MSSLLIITGWVSWAVACKLTNSTVKEVRLVSRVDILVIFFPVLITRELIEAGTKHPVKHQRRCVRFITVVHVQTHFNSLLGLHTIPVYDIQVSFNDGQAVTGMFLTPAGTWAKPIQRPGAHANREPDGPENFCYAGNMRYNTLVN